MSEKNMKLTTIIFSLIIIFTGVLKAQQLVDGVAAIVGQELILNSEVEQYVQNYVLQNKINVMSNPEIYKSLKKEVIERLVEPATDIRHNATGTTGLSLAGLRPCRLLHGPRPTSRG